MNEKQMTQQESLAIITKMIAMTQRKMEQSGGGQLLLWGISRFSQRVSLR